MFPNKLAQLSLVPSPENKETEVKNTMKNIQVITADDNFPKYYLTSLLLVNILVIYAPSLKPASQ